MLNISSKSYTKRCKILMYFLQNIITFYCMFASGNNKEKCLSSFS